MIKMTILFVWAALFISIGGAVDICSLPSDSGPCLAYMPHWFFNSKSGKCEEFIYGGCGGNDNKFTTEEECLRHCGGAVAICSLPSDSGPCLAYMPHWFFNSKSGKCEKFIYGGCGGNDNKFTTEEECLRHCNCPQCPNDICNNVSCPNFPNARCQPEKCGINCNATFFLKGVNVGDLCECPANESSLRYCLTTPCSVNGCPNIPDAICVHYICGGCQTLYYQNGVDVTDKCQVPSTPSTGRTPNTPTSPINCDLVRCRQPDCNNSIILPGQCCPVCPPTTPTLPTIEPPNCAHVLCLRPDCNNPITPPGQCCPVCPPILPTTKPPTIEDICSLPSDSGPCLAYMPHWFFNNESEKCEKFIYGGCGGNDNKFTTEEECLRHCNCSLCPDDLCKDLKCTNFPTARCQPKECGVCNATFFINGVDVGDLCECPCDKPLSNCLVDPCSFNGCPNIPDAICISYYCGGCQALYYQNGVDVTDKCQVPSVPTGGTPPPNSHTGGTPPNNHNTGGTPPNNHNTGGTPPNNHNTGGTPPNNPHTGGTSPNNPHTGGTSPNNHNTGGTPTVPSVTNPPNGGNPNPPNSGISIGISVYKRQNSPKDICSLPSDSGPCLAYMPHWFFNSKSGKCEKFIYGGCGGNDNKFTTEEECLRHCNCPQCPKDICENVSCPNFPNARCQPEKCGINCNATFFLKGVNVGDLCECPANESSLRYCLTTPCSVNGCPNIPDAICVHYICGKCQTLYYQNGVDVTDKCQVSSTPSTCRTPNTPTPPIRNICSLPSDSGPCEAYMPHWFFNSKSGKCEKFNYGGCGGNDNRFTTEKECLRHCNCSLCPDDLCKDLKCTNFPTGRCQPKECGVCNATFFVNGVDVGDLCECPHDKPLANCLVDPCSFNGCPNIPDAICISNYCGGCQALYYQNGVNVTDKCQVPITPTGGTPPTNPHTGGTPTVPSVTNPPNGGNPSPPNSGISIGISVFKRQNSPNICSLPSDSGPCLAYMPHWFFNSKSGKCEKFIYGGCGGNDNKFTTEEECLRHCNCSLCPDDLCKDLNCTNFPTARCQPKECGVCNATFFVNGVDVGDLCECPRDKPLSKCLVDPCSFNGCPNIPDAICISNYCGGCQALYYQNGVNVTDKCQVPSTPPNTPTPPINCAHVLCIQVYCDNPVTPPGQCCPECPPNTPITPTVEAPRNICSLPSDSGPCLAYMPHWFFNSKSGKCEKFIYGGCGGNDNRFTTEKECLRHCNCSLCPDDLCKDLNCTNFPTARCQPKECGVCNATFFVNGVDVGDLCECPRDKPLSNCLVDPCSFNGCPNIPDAICISNYCGGCQALYYQNGVNVTDKCQVPSTPSTVGTPTVPTTPSSESGCFRNCSHEVCQGRPSRICTIEVPDCPGCITTICSACYTSPAFDQSKCTYSCKKKRKTKRCLKKWGRCLRRKNKSLTIDLNAELKCARPLPKSCAL